MADTVTLDPGAGGAVIATDDLGAVGHAQWMKLRDGTDGGTQTIASGGGTEAASLRVTVASDSTGVLSVDDNGGLISVDDGAGSLTVDDGAGSLTVDNAGTFAVQDSQKVADNAAFTDGTTPVQPAGYIFDEVAGTALTENDAAAARIDSKRAQISVIEDETTRGRRTTVTAANALKVDGSAVTQPVSGTVTANLAAGTNNIGDVDVLTLPGSLAGIADDAAFTVATSPVLPVGFLADQTSTDSVNEGDIGAARMTLDRKQIVTTTASVDTEGASVAMNIDVDETEDAIKASAGKILGWYIYNDGATEAYVKFYNDTVANVVVGTTVPVLTIPIPAGSGSNIDWSGFGGFAFSAAITIAATTGVATADTGAPAANQVIANVFYL